MGNVCWLNVDSIALVQTGINYKQAVGAFSKFDQVLKGQCVDAECLTSIDLAILQHCIMINQLTNEWLTQQNQKWSWSDKLTHKFVDHFAMDNFYNFCFGKTRLVLDLCSIFSMIEQAIPTKVHENKAKEKSIPEGFAQLFVYEIRKKQNRSPKDNLIRRDLISLFPNLNRITIVAEDGFEFSVEALLEELAATPNLVSKVEIIGVLHKDNKLNWLNRKNWEWDLRKRAKQIGMYLSHKREKRDREYRLNITRKHDMVNGVPILETIDSGLSRSE